MFQQLFQSINQKLSMTEGELEELKSYFIPKKLRKKQYLLQEGDVCKYTAFVEKGLLRTYTVDEKGNEHIIQFSPEGWWVGDNYSFLTGEPSVYNIEVFEDAELLLITAPGMEQMLDNCPKMERYMRKLLQNSMIALQRRLTASLSLTSEEKYTRFVDTYPDIIQRVPQHMVASYLGVTPETLSRIRKQLISGK